MRRREFCGGWWRSGVAAGGAGATAVANGYLGAQSGRVRRD
jgi:hypothetical protein